MQGIPKQFHQIWIGPNPPPPTAAAFRQSWLDRHPGWQMHVWTDENEPTGLCNEDIYRQTTVLAQKADILRYEILSRFGGVYIDIDFECLRNIEPLLSGVSYFFGEELPGRPAIGILGSVAGHPFSQWCLDRLPERWPWQPGRILYETGPDFFAHAVQSYLGEHTREARMDPGAGRAAGDMLASPGVPPLLAFQRWVFYPYYLGERWLREEHPDAYAVHHWQKNWEF
jgi:mannosyltransferase OCH1-like enzyme